MKLKKVIPFYCFIILFSASCVAQPNVAAPAATIATIATLPPDFLKLRLPNDSLLNNIILNEEVVDLVNVSERDTMVPTHYTTHQGGGFGWFIRMIGFWWQAIDRRRYKLVGTSKNQPSLPQHDELTEHDINFDVLPHLKKYQDLMWYGISKQLQRRKARRHDPTKPPYIYPTESTLYMYRIHCELTPPKKLRPAITSDFYPCLPGPNFDRHPNICNPHPSIGLYGPYVLDCNHDCHPEIHPYEWIWWLDLNVKGGVNPDPKYWYAGFMKEYSDRFELWTLPPRVGTISVPFLFKVSEIHSYININHLVTGDFRPLGIRRMKKRLPKKDMARLDFIDKTVDIQLNNGKSFPLHLHTNRIVDTRALQYWLSDVHTDVNNEWVWGNFNIIASVKNAYTARIEYVPGR